MATPEPTPAPIALRAADLPNRNEPDDDAPRGLGIGPGGNANGGSAGGPNGGTPGQSNGASNGNGGRSGGGPPPGQSYRVADPVGVVAPAPGLLDGLAGLGGLGGLILQFLFGA